MKTSIKPKYTANAPRRPNRSANQGIARQPRIVANETSIVAREASCAASGPARPAASASVLTAVGTYTVPAQSPQMEASINNVLRIVRRRQARVNNATNGRQTAHDRTTLSFFTQREGSLTPWRTHASNSAGKPPTTNIARQP